MALRLPTCLALGLLLAACGESNPPARSAHDWPTEPPPASADATPPKPITSLKRAAVKETIARGVGAFLQNITLDDDAVMREGKFHGFKIKTINTTWGIDLKPGDVVTRINGIVPERPEEADAALRALEKAAALKVDFEREGKPRTLELPIVD